MAFQSVYTPYHWTGMSSTELGRGAEGAVYLHRRYNAHRVVVDQIATKIVTCPIDQYRHPWWTWEPQAGRLIPNEILAMQAFQQRPNPCRSIVRLRGWNVTGNSYTVHQEYCPFGDLSEVLRGYRKASMAHMEGSPSLDELDIVPIPEPAIWHLLEGLCLAGLAMSQGSDAGSDPRWHTLLHRDIKPQNIFLSSPGAEFSHYPSLKLGDWGLVIAENLNEDPSEWYFQGTPGYRGPEQCVKDLFDDDSDDSGDDDDDDSDYAMEMDDYNGGIYNWRARGDDPDTTRPEFADFLGNFARPPLTEKLNVYNVGITILNLMNQYPWNETDVLGFVNARHVNTPDFKPEAVAHYSRTLMRTVRACVRYRPHQRPTFAELRLRILTNTNGFHLLNTPLRPDRAQGMRHNNTPMNTITGHDIGRFTDAYPLGMAI